MRRAILLLLALGLATGLLGLPLAAQATPCTDCLDGGEEADCQPGNPSCGCCLWALPLTDGSPAPEPSPGFETHLPEALQLADSVDPDGILHVPRR